MPILVSASVLGYRSMSGNELYEESQRAYDRVAATYALDADGEQVDYELLALFLERLKPPGLLLDVGCGPGQYSRRFATAGFDVVALDNSRGMIDELQRRGRPESVTPVLDDMRSYEYGVSRFDGIWACASLIHVVADQLLQVLVRMANSLAPTGVLMANFAISDFGLRHERLGASSYASGGRFFQHYASEADVLELLGRAGLHVDDTYAREVNPILPSGERGHIVWLNTICSRIHQ